MKGFNLWGYFLFPKIEDHLDKADMILRTIAELELIGCTIEDVIYVDDRAIHIDKIKRELPEVDFIHMWVDVKSFEELKQLLEKLD